MLTTGLIEVILYVEDMQKQMSFYRDTLELPVLYPAGLANYANEMWVLLDTGSCKLALHGGGQKRLGQDRPMLVFGIEDIHAARATLVERGVELQEIFSAAPGVWVCHGVDPEGNPIALEMHD
jgi:predicted enzyme related to lactoylglutathione lyase